MAAFYGDDHGKKLCTTFTDRENCSGPHCPAFTAVDDYYARCSNSDPKDPGDNDYVMLPLNYVPGQNFVWRKIETQVRWKSAPHPKK